MGNFILAFLSRDWAGLALAAVPGVVGALGIAAGRATRSTGLTALGIAVAAIALLLAVGSIAHLAHMTRVRRRHPAPGRLVDVGGYRVHVLAEGEAQGRPSVAWFAGGHAAGYAIHHMHRIFREETRSILVDRPGTGWSDTGPFPRTTAREAQEVLAALDAAGEQGPFVLVGHSFGGLLAANIARLRPERVAALVLVDATPADTVIYGPPIPVLRQLRGGAVRSALPRLFGVHTDFAGRRLRRLPGAKPAIDLVERQLGEAASVLRAIEGGTKSACTGASIYGELSPEGLARVAWDTVVYEGDLGDMPVLLVAPGTMEDHEFEATATMIDGVLGGGRTIDRARLRRFYLRSRERYMTISSRAERVYAPAGTGHNFPFEVPEFLAGVVRSVVRGGAAEPRP